MGETGPSSSPAIVVTATFTAEALEETLAFWVRELGFGMNRAFSRERRVDDIGTYERMCGIHLSLGAKHGVYAKPGFKRKDARYHVDVFAVTDAVYLDDELVYKDGGWCIHPGVHTGVSSPIATRSQQ